jgi:citrate lyase subunit beta/citryl-CoA lyase
MPDTLRPRRSALYIPASNERAVQKAASLDADVIILDLEDSVPPEAKEAARDTAVAAVAAGTFGTREVVIRINGLESMWIARDIAAIASAKPDAMLVPKLSRIEDVRRARTALAAAQGSARTKLWAMVETPLAILNLREIAAIAAMPGAPIECLVMGLNDLAAETGMRLRRGRAAMLPFLAMTLAAARAHGLAILDGTFNALDDAEGFRDECEQGRDLGFDGKTLIHPNQIGPANATFAPSDQEIEWARRVVDAFQRNPDKAVMQVGNQMVERLHERQARRILEVAEAIRAVRIA